MNPIRTKKANSSEIHHVKFIQPKSRETRNNAAYGVVVNLPQSTI